MISSQQWPKQLLIVYVVISVESVVRHQYVDAFRDLFFGPVRVISLTDPNQLSITVTISASVWVVLDKINPSNAFSDNQDTPPITSSITLTAPSIGMYFI